MNQRLQNEGTKVNIVRTRFVNTDSLRATIGDDFEQFVEAALPVFSLRQAEAVVGLCSGLMDGVSGQIVTVDGGANVFENIGRLYAERGRTSQM